RAAEAAGRGGGCGRDAAAGHRTAAAGGRGRVRAAVAGGAGPAAGRLRLPGGRAQRAAAAAPGAVGRGEPARPLVRGRARPRPGRGPGVPAEPHRGAGRVQRARRVGDRAGRRGRAGNRPGVGHPAAAAAGRSAPGPARRRARHPPVRHLGAAGRCWLGPSRDAVLRRGLVRRAPRLVRPLGGRGRARRPAGSGYHPAEGSAGMTAPGPAPRTSTARLQRLLALVPYVVSRKVAGVAETAAAFGISERELVDDLNLLWCVELRSPDPYCPIDLSYEGGEIEVSQAELMDRPLRLAVDEASALLVALRMLAEVGQAAAVPGLAEGSALSRTIAKLEAAAGEAAAPSAQVAVQVDKIVQQAVLDQLRDALARGRRVHLTYYVPGRDEATERDVDPMRLLIVEGRTYLEGWCWRAEAVRLFRLDRVLGLAVLPVAAEVPPDAEPKDLDQGLFRPSPEDLHVVIELGPHGR